MRRFSTGVLTVAAVAAALVPASGAAAQTADTTAPADRGDA